MKRILATVLAMTGSNSMAAGVVPDWQWVNIQPGGEETCGIEAGGIVDEIGRHGDRVLVRYSPPLISDTGGTPCDGGEIFWLAAKDFETMTERSRKRFAAMKEEAEIVRRLLDAEASR